MSQISPGTHVLAVIFNLIFCSAKALQPCYLSCLSKKANGKKDTPVCVHGKIYSSKFEDHHTHPSPAKLGYRVLPSNFSEDFVRSLRQGYFRTLRLRQGKLYTVSGIQKILHARCARTRVSFFAPQYNLQFTPCTPCMLVSFGIRG